MLGTALASTAVSGLATYFVRRVLTPERNKPDDTAVLSVGPGTVTVRATDETVAPGRFGLHLAGGTGHAQLGDVLRADGPTVTRSLLRVDEGSMRVGPARWDPYFFTGTPESALGLPTKHLELPGDGGALPVWHVPPSGEGEPSGLWAVHVHGRSATRQECLRALPIFHRLGVTSLVPSYRNDADAPELPGGRYHLGDTEWLDIEATIELALRHGARSILLVGWSMGAAISLQLLARSRTADRVVGAVFDAPVVDWRDVLHHQARVNAFPVWVARLGLALLNQRVARQLFGVDGPVDLSRFDWVARAGELRHPLLLIHSEQDEFVPIGPTRELAEARPDLARLDRFRGPRHCQEWNLDPERWDRAVEGFVRSVAGDRLATAPLGPERS